MLPLSNIISRQGVAFHCYADDTQLYVRLDPTSSALSLTTLNACLEEVGAWMTDNFLQLNSSKTEGLLIGTPHQLRSSTLTVYSFAGHDIPLTSPIINLGVRFDPHLSFNTHIQFICKTAFFHLRNISKLRPFLSLSDAEKLVLALVSSRLDHCNALLIGIPGKSLQRLKYIQNCAARVLMRVCKFEHITPILHKLHWLPVRFRIEYKICLLTYQCIYGSAPLYLKELTNRHNPTRHLCSSDSHKLQVPKSKLRTMGDGAFQAAPRLWNALPNNLREPQSIEEDVTDIKSESVDPYNIPVFRSFRPKIITVEGGTDVVLPCSLSTKENIESKLFDWRKVAQNDEDLKEVFLYNAGIHYNNGRPGQSEEFKGRVSHFQDELKHANASIIIRNTKISDSGDYTCDFPRLQPPQIFNIELVVEPKYITVKEDSDVVLPCSLSTKENITSKQFDWKKVAQKDDCQKDLFFYNGGSNDNKNCFPGQVSYFPDELKHGNASIIFRNTKVTDSGVYTCDFPNLQPREIYTINLVVDGVLKDRSEENIPGAASKPKVTILDQQAQVSEREGIFNITLQTKVTKTDTYRCVATQEEIKHQIYAETSAHISVSESSNGWIVVLVLVALVVVAAGVLAVLVYKGYILQNVIQLNRRPKVIKVEEGSDVILPCSLWPKEDLRSTQFIWQKISQNPDDGHKVFLYDKGDLYSDECPDQSEQFKGRVSHFPDELKQGNASIIIRNTTRADSGDYRCIVPLIQKPQIFYIELLVDGEYFDEPVKDVLSFKDWSLVSTLLSSCCI
ncbi:uncharacterized protein LOC114554976 [Perca flavescens]|uniref:uncharacterized protein LOC114554976 n=1 Tax=Perca flavescens TaxID=8167 RepID=UPI00106E6AA2|nr:uncharacterized protein LOC114554976 [Perca flavescens]